MNSTLTTERVPAVAPASDRENLVTVLFGGWMTVGLFLDGYFHQNLTGIEESFLTPWHAVFYSGFLASLLWLVRLSLRRAGAEPVGFLRHLPPGYDSARIGIVLFWLGGVGDAAWHTAFGVEKGIDALLSPTHLLLFAGLVLILSVPLRAARFDPSPRPWLQVASLTAVTSLIGFFLNFAWGLGISAQVRVPYDPVLESGEQAVIAGVASMLVTTAVLFVAATILRTIEHPPLGAHVVLFGVAAALVSVAFDEDAEGVAAALVAAVVFEVARRVRGAERFAVGAGAMALWTTYFALLAGSDGVAWQPEIWLGSAVLCALVAVAVERTHPTLVGR